MKAYNKTPRFIRVFDLYAKFKNKQPLNDAPVVFNIKGDDGTPDPYVLDHAGIQVIVDKMRQSRDNSSTKRIPNAETFKKVFEKRHYLLKNVVDS